MNNSGNLFLKKIDVKEINDEVMNWFLDDELMRYYTNSKNSITKNSLIESIEMGEKKGNLFTYGIYYRAGSVLIGTLKLGPINFNHLISDLVVLIGNKDFHGKGLAIEAIKLGNDLAFNEFKLRKLFGGMYESNIASIKAYTRADWIIEGRLKGQFLVNDKSEDRILVACFNPTIFMESEIKKLKENEKLYYAFQEK